MIFTLPNGCKVVYQKQSSDIKISDLFVFVKIGSIYEKDDTRGSSHFIEHMCFKGTRAIPNQIKLFKRFDKHGIKYNAFTDKEYTVYTANCQDEYLHDSIQLFSDMILNSTFDHMKFKTEHNVVIEENIRNQDNMDVQLIVNTDSQVYKDTPYEFPIDDLSYHSKGGSLTHKNTLDMYQKYYVPGNIVISIVTNKSISSIKRAIQKSYFSRNELHYSSIPLCISNISEVNISQTTKYNLIRKSNLSAIYLSLAFRTCPKGNTDEYPLYMLSQILGAAFSSRLFTLLREKHGLTYTSTCSAIYYIHAGHLEFSVTLNSEKLLTNGKSPNGVLPLLVQFLNNIVKNGVTVSEVDMFKGFIRGQQNILLKDTSNICDYNGKKVILEENTDILSYDKLYETYYSRISKRDIDDIIRKYLYPNNLSVTLIGFHLPTETVLKREIRKFGV